MRYDCSTLTAMADRPNPVFCTTEEVLLIGTMATYNSQAEASQGIPQQWRAFRLAYPALESRSKFYGASPCTGDRKIHYLTGVAYESPESVVGVERLTLEDISTRFHETSGLPVTRPETAIWTTENRAGLIAVPAI